MKSRRMVVGLVALIGIVAMSGVAFAGGEQESRQLLVSRWAGPHADDLKEVVKDYPAGVVTVDDIAKRLIDCGFHAPTMSWPVAGIASSVTVTLTAFAK